MRGWFLRSKPTKRRGGRRGRRGERRWSPEHARVAMNTAGWCVLIGALVGGWWAGAEPLERFVAERRARPPEPILADPPSWLPHEVRRHLVAAVRAHVSDDPFDETGLRDAAAAIGSDPWVKRVRRIVRQPDGRIDIHLEYPNPVAWIAWDGEFHLVDDAGVRLPMSYPDSLAPRLTKLITGIEQGPPRPGAVWPGADVQDALRLGGLIAQRGWASQVIAIDMTNHEARVDARAPQIKLLTALDGDDDPSNNPGVFWGRAPGRESFYEPHASTKLANIDRLYERYGSIDVSGRVADVSNDQVMLHPLTVSEAQADRRGSGYTPGRD